jgi:PKD repeat protein
LQFNGLAVGGIEPYSWAWDFGDGYRSTEQNPVHTYRGDGNYTVILIVTDDEGEKAEDTTFALILDNQPPDAPTINGPSSGKVKTKLDYKFMTVDPDGDNVFYCISWGCCGSGDYHTYGPYESGEEVTLSHGWGDEGDYIIQAFAKDDKEAEGDTSTFEITIPRTKAANNYNWLFKIIEQFPIIQRLLFLL